VEVRRAGTGQNRSAASRVPSAHPGSPIEAAARTGCSGAQIVSAPVVPKARTTSLLHTGQPIANADSRPPPVVLPVATGCAGERGGPCYYQTRWWARVGLDPWQPPHEITDRCLVTPDSVLPTLFWPGKPFARRLLDQALTVGRKHKAS
jgi:hypothetical protein